MRAANRCFACLPMHSMQEQKHKNQRGGSGELWFLVLNRVSESRVGLERIAEKKSVPEESR